MDDKQMCEKYLLHLQEVERKADSTIDMQKRTVERWRQFLLKNKKPLNWAKPQDLVKWLSERRLQVDDSTVQKELCILRRLHFFLHQFRLLDFNPALHLPPMVCNPPGEKQFLTVAQCFALINNIDTMSDVGLRDYTMIATLWSTGLRPFELCGLRCRDINLEEATLRVHKGKGNKQRQLFLNDHLLEKLQLYMEEMDCLDGGDSPLFFHLPYGRDCTEPPEIRKPLPRNKLNEVIGKRAEEAGLP